MSGAVFCRKMALAAVVSLLDSRRSWSWRNRADATIPIQRRRAWQEDEQRRRRRAEARHLPALKLRT
jgi:hypothetical protein